MPYEKTIIGDATLYLGDCLEVMADLDHVDAVVTDPPYGIGADIHMVKAAGTQYGNAAAQKKDYGESDWDKQPASPEQIARMRALGKEHIIFGGNYFNLPPTSCWLVWNKKNGVNNFADCELAWSNLKKAVRLLEYRWAGMLQEDMGNKEFRYHPTQKPIAVMEWCLDHVPNAETILDPFMGSGTTGVACANLGRKFIGIEIEPKYFDIACKRIEQAQAQGKLFVDDATPVEQVKLF